MCEVFLFWKCFWMWNFFVGVDGKFYCKVCKKLFYKERFFKIYKCMLIIDYVDIIKKSVFIVEYGMFENFDFWYLNFNWFRVVCIFVS